jgi:D-glycero-alpha-D-manno-heptose-7-phosphate kinase
MLITKTPARLPLGGGGTDLAEFYSRNGSGYTLSLAIDKYVFCLVRQNFEKGVRFTGYHRKEIVGSYEDLENPMARAVLQYLDFREDIEIVTMSDIRTNCGLGTSSAFVVGLLHALRAYRGEAINPIELARDAITVEREIVKEKGGVQDQYAAALGGLVELHIDYLGSVRASKLDLTSEIKTLLEDRLVIYDTKVARISANIQAQTAAGLSEDDKFNALKEIYFLGLKMRPALLKGALDEVGDLMNIHWEQKRLYTGNSATNQFQKFYDQGIKFGATGGKLMGAGGGGYFLFVAKNNEAIQVLNQEFEQMGFGPTKFHIAEYGTEIIFRGNF